MLKFFIAIILSITVTTLKAQLPVFNWAKAFTNATDNNNYRDLSNGRSVAVDKNGNVYSTGLFQYTIDLDPGPGVFKLKAANYFETAIYISKLDANGKFVWGIQVPVLVEWAAIELKVDDNGNVYLASLFSEQADMDPGPGVYMMSPIGFRDAFVLKLDTNGNFVWVKQFGGPGDTGSQSTGIDIDSYGNVVVCGAFNNTIDFDPGPGTYNMTSSAHIQSFIVKLSNNGDFVWAEQFGNSTVVYQGAGINDVKCDIAGNIFVSGTFMGNCDFDPGSNVYNMQGISLMDGFISKLNADGNFVWAKRIGNNENDYYQYIQPRGIDLDSKGNVITTGYFLGNIDFDPGSNDYIVSNSMKGVYEGFVLKLNNAGDFTWAKKAESPEGGESNDVSIDNADNIYVIGDYTKGTDFDPGPGTYYLTDPGDYLNVLMKLDGGGNFIYAINFPLIDDAFCLLRRMDVDDAQNIFVTGYIGGTIDFDPGLNEFLLTSTMDESPFVLKLGRCLNATTSDLHINTCNSYTLNNETFDTSGVYVRTISNSFGCDSVITLHLTVNKKSKLQTITICEGESFFVEGSYQTLAGLYTDSLQTTLGCDSIVTTQLIVHPRPRLDLGTDRDICNNSQATITPGAFTSYLWQDGSTEDSYVISTAGEYWVKVLNEFNCSATDSLTIRAILPSPADFLKTSDSICPYETLKVTSINSYNDYTWSTGVATKEITVQQPGIYWLTVRNENGCIGVDSITIFQKQCTFGVFIPSAFTPNGDNKNDLFKPQVFGNVLKYHFAIYNRWGETIFESYDPHKGWNGTYNGVQQTTGTFIWMCNIQLEGSQEEHRKGSVLLLR